MYIIAELHPMYGAFKQIQKDNYPFIHTFTSYLLSISQLGMERQLPVDALVGFIEDSLIEGRLPDIPNGDSPIKFKFSIDQPLIQEYFDSTFGYREKPWSHKRSLLLIIRMTLRLSEVYGTSLARLTTRIQRLLQEPAPVLTASVSTTRPRRKKQQTSEDQVLPPTTSAKPASGNRVKLSPDLLPSNESPAEPVVSKPAQDVAPKEVEESTASSSTVLKRLERLTEEGEKLLQREEELPVVETNPALSDFFG